MKDSSGYELKPAEGERLRGGQWVCFNLSSTDKQKALIAEGAHVTRDGSLTAIFVPEHRASVVSVKKADGSVETSGGDLVPAHFQLVTKYGNNLTVAAVDPISGHTEVANVWFHASSPSVISLRAIDNVVDLPPHRVQHSKWLEALHNQKQLPGEVHARHNHEMTAEQFLNLHAALPEPQAAA